MACCCFLNQGDQSTRFSSSSSPTMPAVGGHPIVRFVRITTSGPPVLEQDIPFSPLPLLTGFPGVVPRRKTYKASVDRSPLHPGCLLVPYRQRCTRLITTISPPCFRSLLLPLPSRLPPALSPFRSTTYPVNSPQHPQPGRTVRIQADTAGYSHPESRYAIWHRHSQWLLLLVLVSESTEDANSWRVDILIRHCLGPMEEETSTTKILPAASTACNGRTPTTLSVARVG